MKARTFSRLCLILAVITLFSFALGEVLLSYPPVFAPHNLLPLALMVVPPVAFLVCAAMALALSPPFVRMRWAFLFTGVTIGPTYTMGMDLFAIDLLPDFIGYIPIVSAANGLLRVHPKARSVRNLGLALNLLAIPACVQWRVITSKVGNLTFFAVPLFPLDALVAILDLIMVWMLCGLVADLARQAGATRTEQSALSRRKLYVGLKLLFVAGSYVAVFAAPDLMVPAVIGGLVLALVMVCLMMGLMSQAQRVCSLSPVVAGVGAAAATESAAAPVPSRAARLLGLGGVLLPVVLLVGLVCYCIDWRNARVEETGDRGETRYAGQNDKEYKDVADAFWADIGAGRLEAAYQSTSAGFKRRMSQQGFIELVNKYPVLKADPKTIRAWGHGESGPRSTSDAYLFHNQASYEHGLGGSDGKYAEFTITVVREDRIFHYRPRPPRVDEFTVKELDSNRPFSPPRPFGGPPALPR